MNEAERKQKIGFIILGILFLCWTFTWDTTPKDKQTEEKEKEDLPFVAKVCEFFKSSPKSSKQNLFTLNTATKTYSFTEKGATPQSIQVRNYPNQNKEPVQLFSPDSHMGWLLSKGKEQVKTSDLNFTIDNQTEEEITFVHNKNQGDSIKITYGIAEERLAHRIDLGNDWDGDATFYWYHAPHNQETHKDGAQSKTYLYHGNKKGAWNYLKDTSGEKKPFLGAKEMEDLRWVSFQTPFFIQGLILPDQPKTVKMGIEAPKGEKENNILKKMSISIPFKSKELAGKSHTFDFYFGPNTAEELKKIDNHYPSHNFSSQHYVGWKFFGTINTWVFIPLFTMISNAVNSIGLALILFILLITLLFSFFDYKAHLAKVKMKIAKPFLEKIKPEDPSLAKMEESAFYKKVGINPLAALFPAIIQILLLVCTFAFLGYSIKFRQQQFLWISDLSSYDDLIKIPIEIPKFGKHISLLGVIALGLNIGKSYFKKQEVSALDLVQNQDDATEEVKRNVAKALKYITPVLFFVVLNWRVAALALYFLAREIFGLLQNWLFGRLIDEKAIEKKIAKKAEDAEENTPSQRQSRFERRMLRKK